MMTCADAPAPRIWVGCLACYNAGRLVGRWFGCTDPDEVDAIDLEAVHADAGGPRPDCEELWIMDSEMLPVDREMGLLEAKEWAECVQEAGLERWPAVSAWVRSGAHVTQGRGDIPSIVDFEERYQGFWESFAAFAENLADETGMMAGWPEEAVTYFSWTRWRRDLVAGGDYFTCAGEAGT